MRTTNILPLVTWARKDSFPRSTVWRTFAPSISRTPPAQGPDPIDELMSVLKGKSPVIESCIRHANP
jgi:hypothetical protein